MDKPKSDNHKKVIISEKRLLKGIAQDISDFVSLQYDEYTVFMKKPTTIKEYNLYNYWVRIQKRIDYITYKTRGHYKTKKNKKSGDGEVVKVPVSDFIYNITVCFIY